MDTIDLYAAIEEMKRISDTGGTFSMKFRKYNRHTSAGGDMVTVKAAKPQTRRSRTPPTSYSIQTRRQAWPPTAGRY